MLDCTAKQVKIGRSGNSRVNVTGPRGDVRSCRDDQSVVLHKPTYSLKLKFLTSTAGLCILMAFLCVYGPSLFEQVHSFITL